MVLGTTNLSFTCQRKTVWGPQPGCSLRKFPSLQRQSREGKGHKKKLETRPHVWRRHTVCPSPSPSPGLEDEREVLLSEKDSRGVPADLLHIHVHHH